MSIHEFIAATQVSLSASLAEANPYMLGECTDRPMTHWKVVIKAGRSRMTTYFSKGLGHRMQPPTAPEVLDCLASDASSADQSFEDWASDLGLDSDSRTAHRTYQLVQRQSARLHKLLGDSAYQGLLNCERL